MVIIKVNITACLKIQANYKYTHTALSHQQNTFPSSITCTGHITEVDIPETWAQMMDLGAGKGRICGDGSIFFLHGIVQENSGQ